jgi:hypothetical protein
MARPPRGTVRVVRHVTDEGLDQLDGLLDELRRFPQLTERKRGVFVRGSRAFLHFHEDPSGLYADVRLHEGFDRFRVQTQPERRALVRQVATALDGT